MDHPAAKLLFERSVREFADWMSVPENDRSAAPAWWWPPAADVAAVHDEMPALLCHSLGIRVGSTFAQGAEVIMATLAGQASMTWPEDFPRKIEMDKKP